MTTLQERLRDFYECIVPLKVVKEAADALDAQAERIKALEGALRQLTMPATQSGYGHAIPPREVVDEARALLDAWSDRARALLGANAE